MKEKGIRKQCGSPEEIRSRRYSVISFILNTIQLYHMICPYRVQLFYEVIKVELHNIVDVRAIAENQFSNIDKSVKMFEKEEIIVIKI